MDMFTNYQNLSDTYIPNNLSEHKCKPESYTKLDPCELTKPYELYDAKGELEGYFWYYGETINLDFSITGEIILDDGSLSGDYIDAADFLKDKLYAVKLYDFRFNEVYTQVGQASDNIIVSIDKELSQKLVRGIYYCSLEISGKNYLEKIFDSTDCKLLVK